MDEGRQSCNSTQTVGWTVPLVTVTGFEFLDGAYCKFGEQLSLAATTVGSTQLRCVTPPLLSPPPQNVTVEVTNNQQDFTFLQTLYTYFGTLSPPRAWCPRLTLRVSGLAEMPQVAAINPTTGPVQGQTVVTVFGNYFLHKEGLYCQFGTASSAPATYITYTHIECLSPPVNTSRNVSVEVSINDQDYTTNQILFEYLRTSPRRNTTAHLDTRDSDEGGLVLV